MKSFLLAPVLFFGLFSACKDTVPCVSFCAGTRWHVQRFRSSSEPTTFPRRKYPLLDALTEEQNEWVVTSPGCLLMHSTQGSQTTVHFVQQGDTLHLVFSSGERLRLLIQTQNTRSLELQTLEMPQTVLFLTGG